MEEKTTDRLTYIAVAIIALALGLALSRLSPGMVRDEGTALMVGEPTSAASCDVALVKLQGTLVTYDSTDLGDTSDPNYYDPGETVSSERLVREIETDTWYFSGNFHQARPGGSVGSGAQFQRITNPYER
jgi:hypothetical protein